MRWSLAIVLAGCTSYHPPGSATDAHSTDTTPDTATGICPPDFQPITGGQANHVYRIDTMQRDWQNQVTLCELDGGYLAIPDSDEEMEALFQAGNGTWVGVDDQEDEGLFVDRKQNLFSKPVAFNTADSDCVAANDPQTLEAGPCLLPLPAICECDR